MTTTVLAADNIAESGLALLRSAPGFEVVTAHGKPDVLNTTLPRADVLLVRSETQVTDALMGGAPAMKLIGRAGMGVDNIDVAAATRRGITVLNTPGANTVSAAEHAIGLMLALVRRIPWAAESMRRGEWDRKKFAGTELHGKTLGVVGLGRIGSHVAGIARAFGMKILAHDPYLSDTRARELGAEIVALDDLLARSDIVTLHVALTDKTRNLIDARRLALMKPRAALINTARGGLVDEAALCATMQEKRLAGAALDVYQQEPLPADSPLRKLEAVVLTPHLAASTGEAQERTSVEICGAVRDAITKGEIRGAVNAPGSKA
jgi:D-3-phosphoglycerate dehydrogenase